MSAHQAVSSIAGLVQTVSLPLGAKVAAVDVAKATALHHACVASAEGCVKVLLEVSVSPG